MSLLFLKTCEIWNVLEEAFTPGGEGPEGKTTQNVTVGGMDETGKDATNELSYIGLDAYADIRTVQPNFGVRIKRQTRRSFSSCGRSSMRKTGFCSIFSMTTPLCRLWWRPDCTMEDARNYGVVGCLEPNAQGKTFGSTFAVQFNGIKCLELALSNGIDNIFGHPNGIETGDPAEFKSFDDVWNAYDAQFTHFIGQMVKGMACLDQAIAENVPSPFASAMIDGPIEKGLRSHPGRGRVQFHRAFSSWDFPISPTVCMQSKKRFLKTGNIQWPICANGLAGDWMDQEEVRNYLLHKVAKYGNDAG